jgi:hypothetical protein
MSKKIASSCIGMCAVLLSMHDASAQQPGAGAPTPLLEVYGCNFVNDNDIGDWNALATRFNAWADRNNLKDYTAFTMLPYVYSDQLPYDVLWLGAFPNGAAMGADEAVYFARGAEIETAFGAIVDCSIHQHFAALNLRTPGGPPPETNGIASFSDCKVSEGRTVEEAVEAIGEWNAYLTEHGSDLFSALLFPLAGETAEADYDFKAVEGFSSIEAYGRNVDVVTSGGFRRADELFGRLLDCDSPRLYRLNRVRLAADG